MFGQTPRGLQDTYIELGENATRLTPWLRLSPAFVNPENLWFGNKNNFLLFRLISRSPEISNNWTVTMHEYFKNLDTVDPLFHALVLSRIRLIQEREGMEVISIDALTEEDELEILRSYCMTLYKEYRTLRTIFLENMQVNRRAVGFKHSTN